MKKRILTFLTLLVAFFGLIGLTTNNYAVINAAGNDASVEYDANVAISNVPDSAILSFPLTYESVYGNTITWSVNDNEFIKYELEAQWMVVYRSLEQDGSATVTVTVTNGTTTVTKTKEVSVPKGYTSAPMYSITYELDGGTLEGQKTEYKLGDPSYELPIPTKQGHVFLGWFDENDDKVETILVGSMKNYNLTAKWEERAVKEIEITKAPNKVNYKGGETIDLTGIQVTAHYNDGTTEAGVTVTAKEYVNYGEEEVEVTYKVGEQEFKASYAITVVKNTFEVTFNGDTVTYDGEAHSIYASVATLPTAITVTYEGNEQTDANEEGYTVTAKFSWNESDQNYEFYHTNYDLPANLSAKLIIEKANIDLSGITFEGKEVTYDGDAHTVVLEGELPAGITGVTYENNTLTNVGEIDATATLSYDQENYNVPETLTFTATISISKATLKLTADSQTISINDIENLAWNYTVDEEYGFKALDNLSMLTIDITYSQEGQEVTNFVAGETYDVAFNATADNYTVIIDATTLTISVEAVMFEIAEAPTYNGEALESITVKAYRMEGETKTEITDGTITYSTTDLANAINAGTHNISVTLTGSQYGANVTGTAVLTIAKKAATLTAKDSTSVYGDTVDLAYEQTGILNKDLAGLNIKLTRSSESLDAAEYTVTLSYDESSNYDITLNATAKHTITPRSATLTVTNTSSVYGDDFELKYTQEGILAADLGGLEVTLTRSSESLDAAEYTVTLTYTANANYNITVTNGTHTITPKELTNNDVTISVLGSDYNAQKADTLTPSVKVMYGETEITSYTLAYAYANETTKVGTATITITLNGNYEGALTATFEVTEYGQAKVLAEELEAEKGYKTTLTGEVESIDQLVTSYEGATIKWISTSTALSIAEDGTVTVTRPEENDETVQLFATVDYGTTSSYALAYEFVIPALEKVTVDFGENTNGYTFSSTTTSGNYEIVEGETLVAEYDITVLDGETEISNPGEVTVKLLIPEAYRNNKENLKVYHINDSEEKELMENVTVSEDGKYLVFTATEFSPYVIVLDQRLTVKYVDYDGTELLNKKYYGKEPAAPVNPTREADETYTYVFKEWTKEVEGTVTTYTATYTLTYIEYTVTFKFENGSDDDVKIYHYGDEIVVPENPTKEADEEYTYTFIGWDEEVAETVTKSITYTAQYAMNPIVTEPQEEVIVARFNFGENGTNGHKETTNSVETYNEESNGYTLSITKGAKMYINCNDGMGKSAIKLGTGSVVGGFTFEVDENITKVIIYVAGYKDGEAKISINGGDAQTISKLSDNGEYTAIEVDTSTNKTISFTTLSGGYRCMINKIEYRGVLKDGETALEEEKEKYLVEFDSGSAENTINWYEQDQMVEEPKEEPQKDGYEFLGWYVEDEEVTFPYLVTKNVTFTAKWKHIHNKCEECGKCTSLDCDGAEEEKCQGHEVEPELPGAEPVSVTLTVKDVGTANGWVDSSNNLSAPYEIDENISISIAGGSNSGKFYTDHLRVYATDSPAGSITITAKEGYKIKSVSFGLVTGGTYAFLQYNSETVANGQVVEVGAATAVFNTAKNGANGKQVRVLSVTVVYEAE